MPHNNISLLIPKVCQTIIDEYKDDVMKCPTTPEEWLAISDKFARRGETFPIHVVHLMASSSTASVLQTVVPYTVYYKYKGFYSVVLMSLVDADYKFIWAVIGGMGSASDAQIYNAAELKECVEECSLGFPDPQPLPNDNLDVPYFCLHLIAAVRWLCVERSLHARCMRASCALHARAIRSARQQHVAHSLTFLTRALCMRYACALHTSSALATRCACVVNSLASSKF